MIDVRRQSHDDPAQFQVIIRQADGESRHRVTMDGAACQRLGAPAERCIQAAFRFLLDREPRGAILSRFDISVIGNYFPEFEREWPRYLSDPRI